MLRSQTAESLRLCRQHRPHCQGGERVARTRLFIGTARRLDEGSCGLWLWAYVEEGEALVMNATEQGWLSWAWRVLTVPRDHLAAGREAGGTVDEPTNLNVGYVGENYPTSGGVLCVGLAWGHPQAPARPKRLEPREQVVRRWMRTGRSADSDHEFMTAWRASLSEDLDLFEWWGN